MNAHRKLIFCSNVLSHERSYFSLRVNGKHK